jgi:hypothetical protein
MEKCPFTEQDAQVVDQIREVLEQMKFAIEDTFCDRRRFGYRIKCDHGELPFKALITYDPKEEAIGAHIFGEAIVPQSKFQAAYACMNEVNSRLIIGHFTLCRHCGEIYFYSGVFITTQDLFKERLQANLEHMLKEAYGGNSLLSERLSPPMQEIQKEGEKV